VLKHVVRALHADLLLLYVDLHLAQLGVRQPHLDHYAVAVVRRGVFVREAQEHVLCAEVLLLKNLESRLRTVVRQLLLLDVDFFFGPDRCLGVHLLLALLLLLECPERL